MYQLNIFYFAGSGIDDSHQDLDKGKGEPTKSGTRGRKTSVAVTDLTKKGGKGKSILLFYV